MPVGDVKLRSYTINYNQSRLRPSKIRHSSNARSALVTTVILSMLLPIRFTFPTTFDREGMCCLPQFAENEQQKYPGLVRICSPFQPPDLYQVAGCVYQIYRSIPFQPNMSEV